MKRITSALLLASIIITGGATVANAAPAKSGTAVTVVSPDRVNGWPF